MEVIYLILMIVLIMYTNYKGHNLALVVPVLLLVVTGLSFDLSLLMSRSMTYFDGLLSFVAPNFLLFFLGTLFGDYLIQTGLAHEMAELIISRINSKHILLALILFVTLLLFGGISAFVVVFALYPITKEVLPRVGLDEKYMMNILGVGMATYMIGSMPGSPQIHNIIPTLYFDTDLFAAPLLGYSASIYLFFFGYLYTLFVTRKTALLSYKTNFNQNYRSLLPILSVLGAYMVINLFGFNQSYKVSVALLFGIGVTLLLNKNRLIHMKLIRIGLKKSLKPLFYVGSMIAFGTVISSFNFIESFKSSLLALHPFVTLSVSNYLFSGITGSASGAMSLTLSLFGTDVIQTAKELGISNELLHRVTTLSAITFDTLPTNGTTVSILYIAGLRFKDIYKDYFVITVLGPFLLSLVIVIISLL